MPTRTDRTILGIDPGFARLGFALVRGNGVRAKLLRSGTFTTPQQMPQGERYVRIARALKQLIHRTRPSGAAIERLFFQSNARTAMTVSEARGIILLTCAEARLPIIELSPNVVKRAVAGHGAADKRAVQKMVQLILQLPRPITDDDAADAVAIALAGLQAGSHST